jgi:hypothetical protein
MSSKFAVVGAVCLVLATGPGRAVQPKEDKDAARQQSLDNLRTIVQAMHNHVDVMGTFPPAAVVDRDNRRLLSWRVLLLPFLNEQKLFKEFKLTDPWDSPHNKKLLTRMPKVYTPVHGESKPGFTYYQVFTGQGTAFEGIRGTQIIDFTDGTSNTILLIEAGDAVPWTKPADLVYDSKKPLPKLGGLFPDVIHVGVADGSVRTAKRRFNETVMRLMITRNDGQPLPAGGLDGED